MNSRTTSHRPHLSLAQSISSAFPPREGTGKTVPLPPLRVYWTHRLLGEETPGTAKENRAVLFYNLSPRQCVTNLGDTFLLTQQSRSRTLLTHPELTRKASDKLSPFCSRDLFRSVVGTLPRFLKEIKLMTLTAFPEHHV